MNTISAVNILSPMYAKSPAESQSSAAKSEPKVAVGETSPLTKKVPPKHETIYEVAANARTALDASYEELGVSSVSVSPRLPCG
ncbi:hypothetical protein ABIE64_004351 [Thalassospira sp. MBR-102]|jgi:hypothetical protein|uniref:hypothetical protein n=1 Tax=Thalassospira sp. MBR-102 TaxID=3156466 RepID=UPI00339278DD